MIAAPLFANIRTVGGTEAAMQAWSLRARRRIAFETRCETIRSKIGLSSLRDFTNCCAPKPSNELLGYFRTSLAGQRQNNGTKPLSRVKTFMLCPARDISKIAHRFNGG